MAEFDDVLPECLDYCGLEALPPHIEMDSRKLWIKAIAVVRKSNGRRSLAIIERDEHLSPRFIKTFGSPSTISKVESIHPYTRITAKLIPQTFNAKGIHKYLLHHGYTESDIEQHFGIDERGDMIFKDRAGAVKKVVAVAVKMHKAQEQELQRYESYVREQQQRQQPRNDYKKNRNTQK